VPRGPVRRPPATDAVPRAWPARLLPNLLLALATVVVVGGGAEALARWREPPRLPIPPANDITRWGEGESEFYTIKSSATGWPPWEDYNSEGVRDREHALAKPPGVRRLVCLGDSVTLGTGLAAEDAYPQLLQDRFDALGEPIEVLNVALGGWSTGQEHVAYTRIARKYHPDLVLLGVCLNDLPELHNNLARPPGPLRALYSASALVRWAVGARAREIASIDELFSNRDAPRVREAFARFFAEVEALEKDVRGDGARLALLVLPYRGQMAPGGPPPTVQDEIAGFCRRRGLPMLDARAALGDLGASAFTDHVHLTADATQRVADAIAESDLIPPTPECVGCRVPLRAGPSRAALPELLAALGAADEARRAAAARALGNGGGEPARVVPALGRALDDPSARVRGAAAWALGHFPLEARVLVPALRAALADRAAPVRAGAAWSLGEIGPEAGEESARLLTVALRDPDAGVRRRAGAALTDVAVRCRACLPELIEVAASPEHPGRAAAAWAMGAMGPAAAPAVDALLAALRDPRAEVRSRAVWALGRIGPAARAAVTTLVPLVDDPALSWRAIDALGGIGPPAEPAVPRLVRALADTSGSVRWRAAQALGAIGAGARAATPALLAALGDAEGNVRLAAAEAAVRVEADAHVLAPALARASRDEDGRVRVAALHGLAQLGGRSRAELPAIIEATRDPDPIVRAAAAHAVKHVGPSVEARALLTALAEHDPDPGVRAEAGRGLRSHQQAGR